MWSGFLKEEGFTGLEAAIVMIAFIVVAAVFSYVMVGSGFFTTQKSQDVVYSSVTQASNNLALSGEVFAKGSDTYGDVALVNDIIFYIMNTAGGTPVDLNKTIITYTDNDDFQTFPYNSINGSWTYTPVAKTGNANNLVEKGDVYKIELSLNSSNEVAGPYVYIVSAFDFINVLNTATNTITATVKVGSSPSGVVVSPDGTKVYVTNQNSNNVSVIDTANNTLIASVPVGSLPFYIAISPDGKKVYVTNELSNTISVIDTATNTVTANVPVSRNPMGVAVSPDGTKVYVTGGDNISAGGGNISVIDTSTNAVITMAPTVIGLLDLVVSPDGKKIYASNIYGGATVIDTNTLATTASISTGDLPCEIAITPDGTKVYVTNRNSQTVSVIDTATNTVTANVKIGHSPNGIAITSDGRRVYVMSDDVYVLNTATNTIIAILPEMGNSYGHFIGPGQTQPIRPGENEKVKIEVKPPESAVLAFIRTMPPSITAGEYYTVY